MFKHKIILRQQFEYRIRHAQLKETRKKINDLGIKCRFSRYQFCFHDWFGVQTEIEKNILLITYPDLFRDYEDFKREKEAYLERVLRVQMGQQLGKFLN